MTSAIYQLCDTYVEEMAALDPVSATSRGILGYDAEMTDYSPEGWAARDELNRRVASELERAEPARQRSPGPAGRGTGHRQGAP